jgi:transaldolase
MNALWELQNQEQSIWLDFIGRDFVCGGELKRLVEQDGLSGVTSNPAIFEKAIDGGGQYDQVLRESFARNPSADARTIYDEIAIEDVRNAADVLRPTHEESGGADGFVSIEPPPQLTADTKGTVQEGVRLHRIVNRPNLMIKVAATSDGVAAVEALIAEGININITLIFSLQHYEAVAHAYIRGLDRCQSPQSVASVASFFVSRVDTQVDRALAAIGSPEAMALRGRIAIANAKTMYRRFREIFRGDEFAALLRHGARVQRPLWASTGTKNPAYSDVLYVEELIGPETVNTMPPNTLAAFRDHGRVRGDTVLENLAEAENQLRALSSLGIDLTTITNELQLDGVASFALAYDRVVDAIGKKRRDGRELR